MSHNLPEGHVLEQLRPATMPDELPRSIRRQIERFNASQETNPEEIRRLHYLKVDRRQARKTESKWTKNFTRRMALDGLKRLEEARQQRERDQADGTT